MIKNRDRTTKKKKKKKAHLEIIDSNSMPFDMSSMQESLNKMLGKLK